MTKEELIEKSLKDKNCRCSLCGQRFVADLRNLYSEPVLFLLKLVRLTKEVVGKQSKDLVKAKAKSSSDGSYLVHWGLVEKQGRGFYKPTEAGVDFILNGTKEDKGLWIVGGQVVKRDNRKITAEEVMSTFKFPLPELLQMPIDQLLSVDARGGS